MTQEEQLAEIKESTRKSIARLIAQRRGDYKWDNDDYIVAGNILFLASNYMKAMNQSALQLAVIDARVDEHRDWVLPNTDKAHLYEQQENGSGIQYFDNNRLERLNELTAQRKALTEESK